jgi:DNA-directed RNA polymerase specialized sigma subunit
MNDLYSDIFVTKLRAPLTPQEEAALIIPAQAGDNAAMARLLLAYGGILVKSTARIRANQEDARQAAMLAAVQAIRDFDTTRYARLAQTLKYAVLGALEELTADERGIRIPRMTMQRYLKAMSMANHDPNEAANLAQSVDLARERFWAVHDIVANRFENVDRLAGQSGGTEAGDGWVYREPRSLVTEPSQYAAEDRLIAELALSAIDDDEDTVVRYVYGFTEGDPVPAEEVAHRLGVQTPVVHRRRASALGKMRAKLGVV